MLFPFLSLLFIVAINSLSYPTFTQDFYLNDKCTIYSFQHATLNSNHSDPINIQLALWTRNWFSYGYNPVILSTKDALVHPEFAYYDAKFAALPTINTQWYERACYRRWLAFSAKGGGTMMDFDVLAMTNNPFPHPQSKGPSPLNFCQIEREKSVGYWLMMPVIFHGGKERINHFINELAEYQPQPDDLYNSSPHVSDMTIALRRNKTIIDIKLGRENANVIHFSHDFAKSIAIKFPQISLEKFPSWTNKMLQVSFVNRKRIDILNIQKLNLDNTVWPLIEKQFPCPIDIKRDQISEQDRTLILSVKDSMNCDIRYFDDFYSQDANTRKSNKTEIVTVIPILDPIKAAIQKKRLKEKSFFNLLGKTLIGSDCLEVFKIDPDHLKWQLDSLIKRKNIIFLPDASSQDLKLYMEYNFGFILDKDLVIRNGIGGNQSLSSFPPDTKDPNNLESQDIEEFKKNNELDLFIYDFITKYFDIMVSAMKKIDQQQYDLK